MCFNSIIKIPAKLFVDKGKVILEYVWRGKGAKIAKTVLKKSKYMGGNQSIQCKDLLSRYSNQCCVVSSHTSVKKNKEP